MNTSERVTRFVTALPEASHPEAKGPLWYQIRHLKEKTASCAVFPNVRRGEGQG